MVNRNATLRAARVLVAAAGIVGAALLTPASATASPPDTLGMGSRSVSLGGAVGATVSDYSANYYNPAGLARAEGLQVTYGYLRLHSMLEINGASSDVEPVGVSDIGLVVPAQFGDFRFAFGLGVMLNDDRLSRTRSAIFERPRWEMYDTRPHKVFLSANLAIRPVDWLYIGAGMVFQAPSELVLGLRGTAELSQPEQFERLEHGFTGDLTSIRYPHVGVQVDPHESFSFGVSYRGEFTLGSDLRAIADASVTLLGAEVTPLLLDLHSVSVSTFGPQQVVLSTSARPLDWLSLSFDLQWLDWSKHKSLIPQESISLVAPGASALGFDLPEEVLGREQVPMNMRDRWVPRFGIEARVLQTEAITMLLRGGYSFERTPIPNQSGLTNFMDTDRHAMSAGLGIQLTDLAPVIPGALVINVHTVYGYLPQRTNIKDSIVDPVGDFRGQGHQVGFGFQLGVAFE